MAVDELYAQALRENAKLRAVCADLLSVRDQFAKAALQGLMANPGGPVQASGMSGWSFTNCDKNDVAELAYIMADAMMAQRTRGVKARPWQAGTARPAGCNCSGIGDAVNPTCPIHAGVPPTVKGD